MTEKVEKAEKSAKAAKPKEKKAPVKKPEAVEEVKEAPKPEEQTLSEKPAEKPQIAVAVEEKSAAKPKKQKKQKIKAVVARGKRKEAVARATVKPGKGRIRINNVLLDAYNNRYVSEIIKEPVRYIGPEANAVDISVCVFGGGAMGQAQAARTAIANALVKYFEEANLRQKFVDLDRSLVVEDTRRVESKKYKGPKARARFQKSYR